MARSTKVTKAVLAGTAGIVLLAAGGGTFAAWSDKEQVESATIASGKLTLTESGTGAWSEDLSTFKAVPGDTITYTDNVTIAASGDNLYADLTTVFPGMSGELADSLDTSFTVNGTTYATAAEAVTAGQVKTGFTGALPVAVNVTFNEVTGVTDQEVSATLGAIDIVLTQKAAPVI